MTLAQDVILYQTKMRTTSLHWPVLRNTQDILLDWGDRQSSMAELRIDHPILNKINLSI